MATRFGPIAALFFAFSSCWVANVASYHRESADRKHQLENERRLQHNPNTEVLINFNLKPIYNRVQSNQTEYGNDSNFRGTYSNHMDSFSKYDPFASGTYRSYGMGKATIPRLEAAVTVLNTDNPQKSRRTLITKIMDSPLIHQGSNSNYKIRRRRECRRCPDNKIVVATKGHPYVKLPEPCSGIRWISMYGPQPGSIIREGTHTLIGRLGYRGKICQYQYQVIVRHCKRFTVEGGNVNCTANDAWGSVCTIACKEGFKLVGDEQNECRGDLNWSKPPPICKRKHQCQLPQMPDNSRIWCQVLDESDLASDSLPENTYCRFKERGMQRTITCIDGYWVKTDHNKIRRRRRNQKLKRAKLSAQRGNQNEKK